MNLSDSEKKLANEAVAYVKSHAKEITKTYADPENILADDAPVSVFMAGSPGAGKTEFSKRLIRILWDGDGDRVVRIDPDELRENIPAYTGGNAYIFQGAVSVAVEKIHDGALKYRQNFILDGTLADLEKAKTNIQRSLDKERTVFIFYIYQEPLIAWQFTQKREEREGRRIEKGIFVDQFFAAEKTVNALKEHFGKQITIYLIEKNFQQKIVQFRANVENIDHHVQFPYTNREKLITAIESI